MTTFHANSAVTIEAIQWTGTNADECREFTRSSIIGSAFSWTSGDRTARLHVAANDATLDLEIGEWIASDSRGFYPIKPDVFAQRWLVEPADDRIDGDDFGSWTETTKAVDEFLEAEGIVAEGWTLAVEQAHGDAPFGRGSTVRVFGSLHLTDAHAVGIAVQSIARIRAVGVE